MCVFHSIGSVESGIYFPPNFICHDVYFISRYNRFAFKLFKNPISNYREVYFYIHFHFFIHLMPFFMR